MPSGEESTLEEDEGEGIGTAVADKMLLRVGDPVLWSSVVLMIMMMMLLCFLYRDRYLPQRCASSCCTDYTGRLHGIFLSNCERCFFIFIVIQIRYEVTAKMLDVAP